MPCNYKEYHPKWTLIVRLIKKREHNRCKFCHLPNGWIIKRNKDGTFRNWSQFERNEYYYKWQRGGYSKRGAIKALGLTQVVLTVAHLDHDKTNNRFHNLAALCQACHLKHDIHQHTHNRKYGRNHKGGHQAQLW